MAKKRGGLPAGIAAARAGVEANRRRVERSRQRDPAASDIAQTVYNVAVELQGDTSIEALPLPILAPLVAAAERAAPGAAIMAGLPRSEDVLRDLAAYFIAGMREMIVAVNVEHFRQWCEETNEAEAALRSAPTSTTEEGPRAGNDDDRATDGTGAVTRAEDGGAEEGERHPDGSGGAEAPHEGGGGAADGSVRP